MTLEGEQGKQVALSGSSWYNVDLNSTSSTQSTVYQSNLLVPPHTTNLVSPTSVTHHLIKKGDTNIPNNGVIKVKHIITEIIGISLVLILISTSVSLKTLRNMSSKNETIPVTHDISQSSVKSDDIYKLFKLYPFTIRPSKTSDRAPQPTSLQSPNNRPSSPPVSEITQLTTSGVTPSVDPGTTSGVTTKHTTSGVTSNIGPGVASSETTQPTTSGVISGIPPDVTYSVTTKPQKPGMTTLPPMPSVTPVVTTSSTRRWIQW